MHIVMNINNWRAICGNYEDQLIIDYLEYRFPLCADKKSLKNNTEVSNHTSAVQYLKEMNEYFHRELPSKLSLVHAWIFHLQSISLPSSPDQSQMAVEG